MKSIKCKLLSLLLAMAMVLSLAPTALAEDTDKLESISVSGPSSVEVNKTIALSATCYPNNLSPAPAISWSSSDTNVATVTPTGVVSGVATGSATITASADGVSGTHNVTVTAASTPTTIPVTGVTITQGSTASGTAGGTVQLSATVVPNNATTQGVDWSSGDTSKATVDTNGLVSIKANATGTVVITATSKGVNAQGTKVSASCTVNIQAAADTPTITVTPAANTVQMGSTLKLTVLATNVPTGATLAWEVSGQGAGNVTGDSSPYIFTPTRAGSVTITAKLMSGSTEIVKNSAAVTVSTSSVTNISVTLTPNSVAAGENATATATIPTDLDYDTVTWTSSNTTIATVAALSSNNSVATVSAKAVGTPTIKIQLKKGNTVVGEGSAVLTITGSAFAITTSTYNYDNNYNPTTRTFTSVGAYAYANFTGGPSNLDDYNISWTSDSTGVVAVQNPNYSQATLRSVGKGTATITVTLTPKQTTTGLQTYTAKTTVTVNYSYDLNPAATVYRSANYNLADTDINNNRSILQQLTASISGVYTYPYVMFTDNSVTGGTLTARLNYAYFLGSTVPSGVTGGLLSDIDFVPSSSSTATKAEFRFTLYYYNGVSTSSSPSQYSGMMTFNISGDASTGDITYTASIGDDVSFVMGDFEDYYYTKTKGSLSYVSFTLPSSGSLYSDRGRLTTSNACYVSPSNNQADLAGVYFTPTGTTATRASTVRISFTAYGNRSNASGTVAITYLAGTAKDITYNVTTSTTLKASDFTDAYKAVVGSTAPTGLTIQFQNVPTNGTLTYKDSSRTTSSTVTLRSSNIKSYNFTTRTSGSNQLGDVTYTASGTKSDTIEYIAYVNNTPQFTGKVVFNGSNASAANMQIAKTSTNGAAVTFSYAEFLTANATVMTSCSYIRIVVMPTGGTLTYNGTAVTLSSTNILPSLLGSLVYRPSNNFNNSTDRFSFLCYDANGNSVGGGQVSIVVTGNTSNSAGVTTVNQFTDVTATAWYRNDLITLVNAGIIQGRGDGKFDPTAELTYGEALKIFMLASGYPAQAETTGKDWAINYKNLAVSNGWISSTIDLSDKISRNAMAELAAKSLGVSPSTSVPPTWKDGTSNSYANALYYTNPQILIGNADGTFMGTSTLKRQEICAIASRILTYRATQQSVDKPAWLG